MSASDTVPGEHMQASLMKEGMRVPPGSLRPIAAIALALLAVVGAGGAPARAAPDAAPPPAVTTAPIVLQEVSPGWEFIGRAEAVQAVDVRARVQGFLQEVSFQEGQDVKTGQPLFAIEPAPYQAALAAAEAQLARAQATLKEAERNLARRQQLRARQVEAQATLDQAIAQRDGAAADVQAAEANLETARINLSYTRIEAAIDGRIGRATITKGNLVGPDSGSLARIVQIDPIRIVYSIDDRRLTEAKRKAGNISQAALNERFVPRIRLPSGDMYDEPGRIDFIDNEVDPNTGTVAVRAIFANTRRLLLPGQFVTLLVQPEQSERHPVVPVAAVQEDREGKYVLLVDPDNRVGQRRIEASRQVDQQWIVEKGLREGETVIVQGQQKVRPGVVVNPVPAQPAAAEDRPSGRQRAGR